MFGHMEFMNWARRNGCPCDYLTFSNARFWWNLYQVYIPTILIN